MPSSRRASTVFPSPLRPLTKTVAAAEPATNARAAASSPAVSDSRPVSTSSAGSPAVPAGLAPPAAPAAANTSAAPARSAARRDISRRQTSATSVSSGRTGPIRGAGRIRLFRRICRAVPVNGSRPVSASYSITPTAYQSAAAPVRAVSICSGAMYPGDPPAAVARTVPRPTRPVTAAGPPVASPSASL